MLTHKSSIRHSLNGGGASFSALCRGSCTPRTHERRRQTHMHAHAQNLTAAPASYS